MSLISKIFGRSADTGSLAKVKLGRFSDVYKTDRQYEAWDRAIDYFERKKYMASYLNFFDFLKNAEENNVQLERTGEPLTFRLQQGSLLIHGKIDGERIRVEAVLAEAEKRPANLLKRLMELNYQLIYSRYALNDRENISIVLDSFLIDTSPYKLYYGLRELALQADKLDDLLLKDFPFLSPVEREHIRRRDEEQSRIQYRYFCSTLDRLVQLLENGPVQVTKQPNAAMYLILESCYRLDVLLVPKGPTQQIFEEIHELFAPRNGVHLVKKIEEARDRLIHLRHRREEALLDELYEVPSTFGGLPPVDYAWISEFIEGECPKMNWYLNRGLEEYALAVSGYIMGYQLFNVSVPPPVRAFIRLYYQVIEEDLFNELGHHSDFHTPDGSLRKKAVRAALSEISEQFDGEMEGLDPSEFQLDYSSEGNWARSFLDMIGGLSLEKCTEENE